MVLSDVRPRTSSFAPQHRARVLTSPLLVLSRAEQQALKTAESFGNKGERVIAVAMVLI
jgi:hypothetical protein